MHCISNVTSASLQVSDFDQQNTTSMISDKIAAIRNDHDYCQKSSPSNSLMNSVKSVSSLVVDIETNFPSPSTSCPDSGKNRGIPNIKYRKSMKTDVKNLKREVLRLRKKGAEIKNKLQTAMKLSNSRCLEKVTQKMTLPAKIFTKMQFRETHKKVKGHRFTTQEKILSLSFYKRSPKCYALLSKCFTLPSAKTLKNLLAKIILKPGINKVILEKIKQSVQDLNEDDRLCTLIFDEMSVNPQVHYNMHSDNLQGFTSLKKKEIADHALTFMVRGVRKNFKQPIIIKAYYFTQGLNKTDLKNIITEVIRHVQYTGLNIIATVCDQSPVNVGAIDSLVSDSKALCLRKGLDWRNDLIIIGNKRIIPIYDIPHIIKGIRNNIITKDVRFVDFNDNNKEKIIKWQFFEKLYEADKSYGELRILHKITEEHVNPAKMNKMKVKLATQIFSHSVAIATQHLVDGGKLDPNCKALVPFCLLIDKLFDSLNCYSFYPIDGKIYRSGVRRNSPHHKLWEEGLMFLRNVKFIAIQKEGTKVRLIEKNVPSVKNFIKTIEGMQAIWKILHGKYSFDILLCRNFNQDPIENFFGSIRTLGARNVSPNTLAFESAFKALLLNNFCTSQSLKQNCEDDGSTFLQSLDFLLNYDYKGSNDNNNNEMLSSSSGTELINLNNEILFPNTDLQTTEGIGNKSYVCGWVLKKCQQKIFKGCKTCKNNLYTDNTLDFHSLISAKEYHNKKWLAYPSKEVVKCFLEIQNNVHNTLKTNFNNYNIKNNIKVVNEILIDFTILKKCEKHKEDLKRFFENICISVILYSWCRSINRILSGKLVYNGDDHTKILAQKYFNKHKNNKNKK